MHRQRHFLRRFLLWLASAAGLLPSPLAAEITEVVLKETSGRFTHTFELGSEETKSIHVNREEGVDEDFRKTVLLVPDADLRMQLPKTASRRNSLKLYPAVFKLGDGDNFDLNLDAFWRHLLGEKITLSVRNEAVKTWQLQGTLAGQERQRAIDVNLQHTPAETTAISGKLIAVPKTRTPETLYELKLAIEVPGSDEKTIVFVPESSITTITCRGETIGDLQGVIQYLENRSHIDNRVLLIFTSAEEKVSASASYELSKITPWSIHLYGTLDRKLADGPENMSIRGVVELTNDTFTPWRDAKVTLVSASDQLVLEGIDLQPGATRRFPIRSLKSEIPSLRYDPRSADIPALSLKDDLSLDVSSHYQVVIPSTDEVKEQKLPAVPVIVLTNFTNVKIPAGHLTIYESESARLKTGLAIAKAQLPALGPIPQVPSKKPASTKIATNAKSNVTATFTRSKDGQPLRPVAIDANRLIYEAGVISTYEFSVAGTNPYESMFVEINSKHFSPSIRTVTVVFDKPQGRKVGFVEIIPKVLKDGTINRVSIDTKNRAMLCLHETPPRPLPSIRLFEADARLLATMIENSIGLSNSAEVRRYLDGLLPLRMAVDHQQALLEKRLDELQLMKERRETYLFQPTSKYHGPIDRHWKNEVQQKEMTVGAQRAVVAESAFQLDAYIQNTQCPPKPADAEKLDFEDLGGILEWEDGKPVLASLGVGGPASSVTDEEMKLVDKPATLRQLSLRGCQNITSAGLSALSILSDLQGLVLEGTRIDDRGLDLLAQFKRLRSVDVRNTLVTFDGVRRLQRQLPHCMVQYDQDLQAASLPARRWIFALTDLTKRSTTETGPDGQPHSPPELGVDDLIEIMEQASELGYNGVVVQDYYLGLRSDHIPFQLFDHLTQLRQAADRLDMEVIPTIIPVGNSESVLNNPEDVHLAEGLPVTKAVFQVKDNSASIVASEHVLSGDFESEDAKKALENWQTDLQMVEPCLDSKIYCSGKQSLKISHAAGSHWSLKQQLTNLKPWHQYRVRFSVKTEDFQPEDDHQSLQFYVHGGLAKKPREKERLTKWKLRYKDQDSKESERIPTTVYHQQDWTTYEFVVNTVIFDSLQFDLNVEAATSGTIWLDNISVQEVGGYDLIRREGCPVKVTNIAGKPYEEGKDFVYWSDPHVDTGRHEPPAIILTDDSQIEKDGSEQLLVSYYHCYRREPASLASCLRHPDLFAIYAQQIRILKGLLRPQTWIMDHDELRLAGHCELCKQHAHQNVGVVLAENVRKCTDLLREIHPDAEIRVWNDMFDPYHNAVFATDEASYYPWVGSSLDHSWLGIDQDVRIVNWSGKVESIKFFAELPRRQLIASYYDDCQWKCQLEDALDEGNRLPVTALDGVMYSTYKRDYSALKDFMDLVEQHWPHK